MNQRQPDVATVVDREARQAAIPLVRLHLVGRFKTVAVGIDPHLRAVLPHFAAGDRDLPLVAKDLGALHLALAARVEHEFPVGADAADDRLRITLPNRLAEPARIPGIAFQAPFPSRRGLVEIEPHVDVGAVDLGAVAIWIDVGRVAEHQAVEPPGELAIGRELSQIGALQAGRDVDAPLLVDTHAREAAEPGIATGRRISHTAGIAASVDPLLHAKRVGQRRRAGEMIVDPDVLVGPVLGHEQPVVDRVVGEPRGIHDVGDLPTCEGAVGLKALDRRGIAGGCSLRLRRKVVDTLCDPEVAA